MHGRRRRGIPVIRSVITLLVCAATFGSAAGQSPETGDPLVDSLLAAVDVPPGLVPQGVDEPPRFDIDDPAFDAQGGVRAVGQVWATEGAPFILVFDHRMEFPDAAAAAAYLDAAEAILSEADATGLAPVMFEEPIGEHARHYFGTSQANDITLHLHNYLFHVGRVAAKVFVASGEDVEPDLAALVAAAAVDRMSAMAGAPAPSQAPSGSASPAASASASPGGSGSQGPAATLLDHVPAGIRASCEGLDASGSEITSVACATGSGLSVLYALYANGIAADGDFATITAGLPTPRAGTCTEGPFLGTYDVGGEVVGQLACWTAGDTAYLLASDKRIPLIVFLLGKDAGLAALEQALQDVAPVP